MKINQVAPSRKLSTIREMVEGFEADKHNLNALTMKIKDQYWNVTYGELQEYVRAVGTTLLKMGVKKGDKIAVMSENRNEWIITYLSVACMGAVIVPLDILQSGEELSHITKASDAIMLFTSKAYMDKAITIMQGNRNIRKMILFDKNCPEIVEEMNKNKKNEGPEITLENLDNTIPSINAKEGSKKVPFKKFNMICFDSLFRVGKRLISNGENLYEKVEINPNDMAALIFTSGTTGLPKGVMLSHLNLIANADGVQMTTKLGPGDNWIIILPIHHTYPTILGLFTPLMTYARITLISSLKSTVFIPIMKETGATCIPAVPILVEKIYKGIFANVKAKNIVTRILFYLMFFICVFFYKVFRIKLGKILLGSVGRGLGFKKLRFIISGGGPIPKKVIDGMQIFGFPCMQGYGLSETSPVLSNTTPTNNKPGSVGLKLVNVEVKIDKPNAMGHGEILAKGPNIMQGYYKMPELTAEVIDSDGWFHTGDIGKIDKDGYLFITGRIKNIIVTKGGKNVYPEEIENQLLQSQYIAEAVIIGKSTPEKGELPYAIVYPNFETISALETQHGHTLSNEEIRNLIQKEIRHMTQKLASYKVPVGFEISSEELPKTSSNKVKRFMFQKR